MKIAISDENGEESFRVKLLSGLPFFGVLLDSESSTKIEFDREDSCEEVAFRTQGERLALWIRINGEPPVLKVYSPSEDIDLDLFKNALGSFYKVFPELRGYFLEGFGSSLDEILSSADESEDRAVLASVFGEI